VKVKVYPTSGCTREIRVEVEADTVQSVVEGRYGEIAREAVLPGFRKGKAPLDLVRRKFKANIKDYILQESLPKYFREAVEGEKIAPIAQPRITEYSFEEGAPLRFVAAVEIKPEFSLSNYQGLKLKRGPTEVSDADVDKAVEDLREHSATFLPMTERPVRVGDLVLTDFEGRVDGVPFEGGKATRYPIDVGHGTVLKDFEDALVGMALGETKEFPVAFPGDYPKGDLAGKTAQFTATVREIKEKMLPTMDDALAKDAFKCENVADLRSKIAEDLKARRAAEQRGRMVDQLAEQLIQAHPFDLPPSLVDLEHQRLARQAVDRLKSQGAPVDTWGEKRQNEFVAQFRTSAERNVRMSMLVDRIAEAENIRCEEADYDKHLERLAQAMGQAKEAVKRYVEQRNQREDIEDRVRYEKTLDFLVEKAKVEEA
jgi:trigger factor